MSKLTIVRQALETNPEIVIAKVFEKKYFENYVSTTGWCHTLDFFIAPKKGLYTADELQAFMIGLVPGLAPTAKDEFRQYKGGGMDFGKLYFDEAVGKEKITRIGAITDEELKHAAGFVDGQRTIEETLPYQRRIWVRPFPSEAFVKDVLENKVRESGATSQELRKYQARPGFFQRLLRH